MSSIDRDPYRRVSAPTEKDFIQGMAAGYGFKRRGGNAVLTYLAIRLLLGKRR